MNNNNAAQKNRTASRNRGQRIRPKAAALAVAACFSTVVWANPTNPTVVHGNASFQQNGNILNVTNSHNAIINWGSFSIGVNELTKFIQPSALSAVLNRVTGGDPSAILGALQSNGRVFLLNPNGIVFGAGSQIDVAGLVASTLNLSNADFLAGRMNFTGGAGAGSVLNQGAINAAGGPVYLVGNAVTNQGIITSPGGEIVLAAGNSVELVNPGTPNLRVEIQATNNEARNLGSIVSEAGRIGIYAGLIKQGGVINADSAVVEGGRIMLKATRNATLEAGSVISAKGVGGGRIEVLADDSTHVAGVLDASAPNGGNGGFIETSGKIRVTVDDNARVSTAAPQGSTGVWLIDPTDLLISAMGGDMTGASIATNLATTSVVLTSDNGSSAGSGDILVNDVIAWNSANSLTLTARRNVSVNGSISNAGSGGINLFAGWDGSSSPSAPTLSNLGMISLMNSLSTAGTVQLKANADINQSASGVITAAQLKAVSGTASVNLNSAANNVGVIAGSAKSEFNFKNAGSLTIGSVGADNGIVVTSNGSALVDVHLNSGDLTVNQLVQATTTGLSSSATVVLHADNGNVTINAPVSAVAGGDTSIDVYAANNVIINSSLSATSGQLGDALIQVEAAAGNIVVAGTAQIAADAYEGAAEINLQAGGAIQLGAGTNLMATTDNIYGGDEADIYLTAAGNITQNAGITADGGERGVVSLNAGGAILQTDPLGFIRVVGPSNSYSRLDLTAVSGIGTRANPVRINMGADPDLTPYNTGMTGDIALSFFNTPSNPAYAALGNGLFIDNDLNGVYNNNPNGMFYFKSDANIILAIPFTPDGQALPSGQSVVFDAPNGQIHIGQQFVYDGYYGYMPTGTYGSIKAGVGGAGNVELIAGNKLTIQNGSFITGREPLIKAGDIDLQGVIRATDSNFGFVDLRHVTGGPIHLGVSGAGVGGALALDNAELNRMTRWDGSGDPLTSGSGGGLLIGQTTGGPLIFKGAVGPTSAFLNARGSTITQDSGAIITGGLNASAQTSVMLTDTGNQINYITGGLASSGTFSVVTAAPVTVDSVSTPGGNINIASSGGMTLQGQINAGAGTVQLTANSIADNHVGLDIIANSALITATAGGSIGSIANPLETSVLSLNVSSSGAAGQEIGVINAGNMALSGFDFGGSLAAIGTTGVMSLSSPLTVMGSGLFLSGNAGLNLVGGNVINAAGSLTLASGSGALSVTGASVSAGGSLGLSGANIQISNATLNSAGITTVNTPGSLSVINGALLSSSGNMNIVTGGNVLVDQARIFGSPDVVMSVGGLININGTLVQPGKIEAASLNTIRLVFPGLARGGFSINGVEGVVYDASTNTGFFAGGAPAVLGGGLKVSYGAAPATTAVVPIDALIVALVQASKPPDQQSSTNSNTREDDKKDAKKDAPACR